MRQLGHGLALDGRHPGPQPLARLDDLDQPEATQPSDLDALERGSELRTGRHLRPIGVRVIEHPFEATVGSGTR